jgi:NADH dehydrogenase
MPPRPFRYFDKGILATIGRARAVADIRGFHIAGPAAWLLWALVHIFFLISFRNRLLVMIQWAWEWAFFQRGARLITGDVDLGLEGDDRGEAEKRAMSRRPWDGPHG